MLITITFSFATSHDGSYLNFKTTNDWIQIGTVQKSRGQGKGDGLPWPLATVMVHFTAKQFVQDEIRSNNQPLDILFVVVCSLKIFPKKFIWESIEWVILNNFSHWNFCSKCVPIRQEIKEYLVKCPTFSPTNHTFSKNFLRFSKNG